MSLHPLQGGLGRQNRLRLHRIVVEEAVSRFGFVPGAAGLGQRRGRMLREVSSHDNQTFDQPRIGKLGVSEFLAGPVGPR